MTALNPFVEFARDPVATAAYVGYGLLMLTILAAAVPWALRSIAQLRTQYLRNRHEKDWYALDRDSRVVIPPPGWWLTVVGVGIVLTIAWWAIGSLAWLLS